MDKSEIKTYKKYFKSLAEYMARNEYTTKPFPKIIFDNREQKGVFVYTGFFDPQAKGVRLFINGRHIKDILRTWAHELIHWKQDKDGVIEKTPYKGNTIINDEALIKLEKEAYLKGNIAFRKWTEIENNKE